jgi:Transcriptional regulator, AbiEi antitoxin
VGTESWARLARSANRSFGLVTRERARQLGTSDKALRRYVDAGVLERLSVHVFRVVGAPRTPEQLVLAACCSAGPGAVASHTTAAALHRFDGCAALADLAAIHVTVPTTSRRTGLGIVHRTDTLDAIDRCRVGPVPATSPVRTLIDLGAVVPRDQVEEALDGAERDGRVDRRVLVRRVEELRTPGRSGAGTIASILEARRRLADLPQSVLERRFLRIVEAAGLPVPVAQHETIRTDARVAYLDFAYPDRLLAIELQGNASPATPKQRAADDARANALPGWRFLCFTFQDVMYEPDYVISTLARGLKLTPVSRACEHAAWPTDRKHW